MKKQKLVNFKELTKLSNKLGESLDTLKTIEPFIKFGDRYKYKNLEEMYAAVGFGAMSATKIIARMLIEYRKEHKEETIEQKLEELETHKSKKNKTSNSGIIVKGIDNCLVKFSKCCNPLPGDEIIGYITKGRGVSVHRKDCINIHEFIDFLLKMMYNNYIR